MRGRKMKSKSILLLLCVVMVVLMVGCSSSKNEVIDSNTSFEGNVVEITKWPQNRFTDVIVEPTSGTVDYVIDDSDNGRYAIFYSEISMSESEDYIEALKSLGYHSVNDKKEDAAISVILEKDNVILSISASEGILGIYVSIE